MGTQHKLFNQLMVANANEGEVQELYEDLREIFQNSFDELISQAISQRGCSYVDPIQTTVQ